MKIERLCIQKNSRDSLAPVRVLRVTDDSNDPSKDYLHVGGQTPWDGGELLDIVARFCFQFPRGKVEVETSECEIRGFRKSDIKWLFA